MIDAALESGGSPRFLGAVKDFDPCLSLEG